jgi:uncharacterized membrane protein YccC
MSGTFAHIGKTLVIECSHIDWRSPTARAATSTTLAVVLAILLGCAMHMQDVWWAGISAYVSTRPGSLRRGLRRILGTVAGATLAIMSIGCLAYDPFACSLALFAVAFVGIIGFNVSRHGYAWLFMSVTFGMVLLASLSAPQEVFFTGVHRIMGVGIGTCTAMAVATILPAGHAEPAAVPRGWSDLLGSGLPITLHAIRAGVTVALIPVVWSAFVLPGVSQMAVTLTAVLATPVTAAPDETHRRIVDRGLQRLLGCFIGGLLALAVLGLGFASLVPWLVALAGGIWLFAYVQHGSHDATYAATQGGVVFMMTLVQGTGPPASMIPGIDRFVGISLGLLMLTLTMFVIGSPTLSRRELSGSGRPEQA